jgi:hypothetical protein
MFTDVFIAIIAATLLRPAAVPGALPKVPDGVRPHQAQYTAHFISSVRKCAPHPKFRFWLPAAFRDEAVDRGNRRRSVSSPAARVDGVAVNDTRNYGR